MLPGLCLYWQLFSQYLMLRAVVDLSCMRTLTRLGVKLGKCQAGVDLF